MTSNQDMKKLRREYPKVLTRAQIDELVAKLPVDPLTNRLAGSVLAYDNMFEDLSELELFWRYQIKFVQAKAAECQVTYKAQPHPVLAELQGSLLATYVTGCLESDRPKLDLPVKQKIELANEMLLAWKSESSEALFKEQMVGFEESLKIKKEVFGAKDRVVKVLQRLVKSV